MDIWRPMLISHLWVFQIQALGQHNLRTIQQNAFSWDSWRTLKSSGCNLSMQLGWVWTQLRKLLASANFCCTSVVHWARNTSYRTSAFWVGGSSSSTRLLCRYGFKTFSINLRTVLEFDQLLSAWNMFQSGGKVYWGGTSQFSYSDSGCSNVPKRVIARRAVISRLSSITIFSSFICSLECRRNQVDSCLINIYDHLGRNSITKNNLFHSF